MEILTENEVTGAAALGLRQMAGLTQRDFWSPLGVNQASGCRYESGATGIPRPVRILLVATYVAGLNLDAATPAGVQRMARLAHQQDAGRTAAQPNPAS